MSVIYQFVISGIRTVFFKITYGTAHLITVLSSCHHAGSDPDPDSDLDLTSSYTKTGKSEKIYF